MKVARRTSKTNFRIFILTHDWLTDIAELIGLNTHLANIRQPTFLLRNEFQRGMSSG
jgi:hypothetical protein